MNQVPFRQPSPGSALKRPLPASRWQPTASFRPLTAEKIVGINNLLNIAWLNRGLELSRTVARIITPDGGLGTGFLIGSDLIITNNHVVPDASIAAGSVAEFNFQKDWTGALLPSRRFPLDGTEFQTNETLDYAIIKVQGDPGQDFGFVRTTDARDPVVNGYVTIIQHANGGPKQIALMDNKVAAVFGDLVQYTTDTEPGSSGSAVFDQDWRLVGLHRAGGMLPGPDGRESLINEAVLISSVLRDAQLLLGATDPIWDLSFGELRSSLVDLVEQGGTRAQARDAAVALACRHPALPSALASVTGSFVTEDREVVAPVAAGVGIGAALRHWARRGGHESIERVADPWISVPAGLPGIVAPYRGSELLGVDIYLAMLEDMQADPAITHFIAYVLGDDGSQVGQAVFLFLSGVMVGAKAYEG